jgi:carbamoylphosphate synthase large subunit
MERESIKAITERVRKERVQGIVNGGTDGAIIEVEPKISQSEIIQPEVAILEPVNHSAAFLTDRQDLTQLLQQITSVKVSGQTKMLIRFDDKHMPVLNMLQPALKINVVQFVNFLVERFFETNPDIKTLMKNSLKNSLKEI